MYSTVAITMNQDKTTGCAHSTLLFAAIQKFVVMMLTLLEQHMLEGVGVFQHLTGAQCH